MFFAWVVLTKNRCRDLLHKMLTFQMGVEYNKSVSLS